MPNGKDWVKIIEAASKSPMALGALGMLLLGVVTMGLFATIDSPGYKLGAFVIFALGLIGIIVFVTSAIAKDKVSGSIKLDEGSHPINQKFELVLTALRLLPLIGLAILLWVRGPQVKALLGIPTDNPSTSLGSTNGKSSTHGNTKDVLRQTNEPFQLTEWKDPGQPDDPATYQNGGSIDCPVKVISTSANETVMESDVTNGEKEPSKDYWVELKSHDVPKKLIGYFHIRPVAPKTNIKLRFTISRVIGDPGQTFPTDNVLFSPGQGGG